MKKTAMGGLFDREDFFVQVAKSGKIMYNHKNQKEFYAEEKKRRRK